MKASTSKSEKHLLSLLLLLLVFVASASQETSTLDDDRALLQKYEQWMADYGRVYPNDVEKETRFQTFKSNVKFIETFNKDGDRSYTLGINQFADLTKEEFLATYTGLKPNKHPFQRSAKPSSFNFSAVNDLPIVVDWRKRSAVTPVKSQLVCGSCWAFSAVATIEGITSIKTGKLISLSEQQIIDCNSLLGGCRGGYVKDAYDVVIRYNGISSDTNYPYTATDGVCDTAKASRDIAARISGWQRVPPSDEAALAVAVANQPVSVNIDPVRLQFYKSGIISGECGNSLTHAVTAVGYGIDTSTLMKFWLVKNSWGSLWGDEGYFKLERDAAVQGGTCGIALDCLYPTVA